MELKNRKINRFRTYYDPSIGAGAKLAFDLRAMPNAEFELTPIGVYVKIVTIMAGGKQSTEEHLIPYANIQSMRLCPIEDKAASKVVPPDDADLLNAKNPHLSLIKGAA